MGKHKDRDRSRERHHKKRKKERRERSYSEESDPYSRTLGRSASGSISPPPKKHKARQRSRSISPPLWKNENRYQSQSGSPRRKQYSRHNSRSFSPPPRKQYSRNGSSSVSPPSRKYSSRNRSRSVSPPQRKHDSRHRSRSLSPPRNKLDSPPPRKPTSRCMSRSLSPPPRKQSSRHSSQSVSPPPRKQSSRHSSQSVSPRAKKHKTKSKSSSHHKKSPPPRSYHGDSESESSNSTSSGNHHSQPVKLKASAMRTLDQDALQEERKRQKELIKSMETPEEKRARRLAKKEAKERKRKERMGWDKDYSGYTNADNPFGDEHLLDTFTWAKKMEKEGKKHLPQTELQILQHKKMDENRRELEKVKKRRLEREREMEQRDKEREAMQRDKEADYYREWEKQEDSFHLNQAKLRSKIRIQDGRAKPIDLLAKYISAEDDELAIEMHEPYTYLYGLTIQDLEDLLEDIKVYLELEQGKNVDYWRDIITVTEDELTHLRKMDPASREFYGDRREGVHSSVNREVEDIFKGKTTKQLRLLEASIQKKLQGGEGVDVGYWEALLQQLKAHMARTRLRERHQDVLRQKLLKLKREQGIEPKPLFPVQEAVAKSSSPQPRPGPSTEQPSTSTDIPLSDASAQEEKSVEEAGAGSAAEDEVVLTEADVEEPVVDEYEAGGYTPRLVTSSEVDIDAIIYNPVDDLKKLELAREQVLTIGKVKLDTEGEFERKAKEGMNAEEAQFSVEMPIEKQAFLWSDKYRPRKPRFFNRVHTGFEWNKYNQTHYDIDNPPPKIVQGYKFNIFYPDLIDKTQTPQYTVTPMEDNKDFACLRFRAGPPYEDIAFKIVNREWEYSYKRGFRCQFHNNIFQLWFHFKRYRYRR